MTVVSDRESEIYEDSGRRPETGHLSVRSGSNRNLAGTRSISGGTLLDYADALPEMGRFHITVPAKPGQPARLALLAVRFSPLAITRPQRGMPSAALDVLPQSVYLHLVDVRKVTGLDARPDTMPRSIGGCSPATL